MDFRTLFSQVRRRPQMYGVEASYRSFCTFLSGVNIGNDEQLLAGFREFLIVRAGVGTNLAWPSLVLRLAFPEMSSGWSNRLDDPVDEHIAVDTLFNLLGEFLERTSRPGETARICEEYLAWQQARRRS